MERTATTPAWFNDLTAKAADRNASEEDIRSLLVSGLMEKTLSYPNSRVATEVKMPGGGRADIQGTRIDGRKIIVEVKRPAVDLTNERERDKALNQARRYGRESDAERVLVTNGRDWIWGLTAKPGQHAEVSRPGYAQLEAAVADLRNEAPSKIGDARETIKNLARRNIDAREAARRLGGDEDPVTTTHGDAYPLGADGADTRLLIETQDTEGGNRSTAAILTEYERATLNGHLPELAGPRRASSRRALSRHGLVAVSHGSDQIRFRVFQDHDGLTTGGFGTVGAAEPHLAWCARVAGGETTRDERLKRLNRQAMGREFYDRIGGWFERTTRRDADLRHLMRIVFCRLLASAGHLKHWTLNGAKPKGGGAFGIHDGLMHLFGEALADPEEAKRHCVPYMNGSLFTPYEISSRPKQLSNKHYRNAEKTGLLDILDGYEWTLDEPTAFATEQRIDPEMLGSLFESLMAKTGNPGTAVTTSGPTRNVQQPLGAYYTPLDVVESMTAEALADAAAPEATEERRSGLTEWFRDRGAEPPDDGWKDRTLTMSVLDPACGSGAFAVAAARMLASARSRLGKTGGLEHVISNQITALDISPMAVQITRLRLYIAAVTDREPSRRMEILPNLETRTKCVDTLTTPAGGQMRLRNEAYHRALQEFGEAQRLWVSAGTKEAKATALEWINQAMAEAAREAEVANPEDVPGFLGIDPTKDSLTPARGDVRTMLGQPDGYDLVIGNPPYQAISRTGDERWRKLDEDLRRGRYLKHGNTYEAFLELAASITKPSGATAMIIPHSLCCGTPQRRIRELLMQRFADSRTRLYDNRPKPVFPHSPWTGTSNAENRQRIAIAHFRNRTRGAGAGMHRRRSTGRIAIEARTRADLFDTLGTTVDASRLLPRWVNTPTPELGELAKRMAPQPGKTQKNKATEGPTLTAPKTAMYFLTVLPAGLVTNPGRYIFSPGDGGGGAGADEPPIGAWIALYNSRVFHAWWLMTGDLFHVTRGHLRVRRPNGWNEERLLNETAEVGDRLVDADLIDRCRSIFPGRDGSTWPNVNFHDPDVPEAQALLNRADRLVLRAYGLENDETLRVLELMRSGSADAERLRSPTEE